MFAILKMSLLMFFSAIGVFKFWSLRLDPNEQLFGFMGIIILGLLIVRFHSLILTKPEIEYLQDNPSSGPFMGGLTVLMLIVYCYFKYN